MNTPTKSAETRALGWYAVQRVRVSGWFHGRQLGDTPKTGDVPPEQDMMSNATNTGDAGKAMAKQAQKKRQQASSTHPSQKAQKVQAGQQGSDDSEQAGGDKQSAEQHLRTVVEESHTLLAKAHGVFPFDFFPDTISLDRHKLTILHREFFGVEQTVSVPIENIKNIEANVGPFLGSLMITSDLFSHNTQEVKYMSKQEALRFQKLVQGAVVAQREEIDINDIDIDKLCDLLIELGSGHSHTAAG